MGEECHKSTIKKSNTVVMPCVMFSFRYFIKVNQTHASLLIMIKQIPIILVVVGIVISLIGVNFVLMYDLSFFTGIVVFFGIAMLVAGIDLKIKIKKLNAKNKKIHHDYTISKLMEDEDIPKKDKDI